MNETLKTILAEAMRLGQDGHLHEAAALIQRELHLPHATPKAPESTPDRTDHNRVIDGDFEVIEDTGPKEGHFIHGRYSHGSESREYRVYVPANADHAARPLILMLHGCQQDADDFARLTRLNQLADTLGFIVLYPAQSRAANAAGCWNWFLPEHQRPDQGEAALLAALTHEIVARHGADPRRLYVAGLSAGGAMALTLAATYPELFVAVGVHSGLPYGLARDQLSALTLMHQGPSAAGAMPMLSGGGVPVIVFQGDSDLRVNPVNASWIIEQALSGADAARTEREQGRASGGLDYTRTRYLGEDGSTRAELWVVHGGGHGWFGGDPAGSFAEPRGPDASHEMLRFFLSRAAV
ncbi:extracellular catalytic domain type 1 short-chain-length polyhydroxyalkanoate depolymerase [Allochromatium palmeri]|uniref:PHB depolymerase family esterase n=1 Tax=Allochromatium palmeri TaxID=231048 RepID=A0A6N8EAZ7_9GAMM|nr:PHB depolymerase family esterase [Allochromatium palmeri]MTW19826.1 PHB depolymerase family esterase [Allochromatium palmeri]